jgi:hypothetical protein
MAFGLRARIEGWSTRPKEKAGEERRRRYKIPLASHHHRRILLAGTKRRSGYFHVALT